MTATFRPAKRSEAKPLIGLYSESGCGKTYSALLLARGFVGPQGRIGMIETEAGRGEVYVGMPDIGHYEVCPIREDFSPKAYGEAISAAEKAGFDALIIDSASHEWEGVGGVLDMAARNQASGKKGPLVWQQPKIDHQRQFMLRLMQTPIPFVIVNMRAKYPMREVQKPGSNSKEWVRSEVLEPKQSDDILFEMFVHAWIDQEHKAHVTKYTRDDLRTVIIDGKPISLETGRALAAWAREEGKSTSGSPAPATTASPGPEYENAMLEARKGTEAFRKFWNSPSGKKSRAALRDHIAALQKAAADADAAALANAGQSEPDEDPMGNPPADDGALADLEAAADDIAAEITDAFPPDVPIAWHKHSEVLAAMEKNAPALYARLHAIYTERAPKENVA